MYVNGQWIIRKLTLGHLYEKILKLNICSPGVVGCYTLSQSKFPNTDRSWNCKAKLIIFNELWGVLKWEEVLLTSNIWTYFSNVSLLFEKIWVKFGLIYIMSSSDFQACPRYWFTLFWDHELLMSLRNFVQVSPCRWFLFRSMCIVNNQFLCGQPSFYSWLKQ